MRETASENEGQRASVRRYNRILVMRIASLLFAVAVSPRLSALAQAFPSTHQPRRAATPAGWPTAQFAATAAKDPGVAKAKKILDDMINALGRRSLSSPCAT